MAKLNIPIIITLVLVMLMCFLSPCLSCPEDQKLSLLEFKSLYLKVYYLSSSSILNSWNSSSDCCTWDRVTCDLTSSSSRPIQKLDLRVTNFYCNEYLDSKILTPIFRIQTLLWLDVSSNCIVGEIPAAGLNNLTRLVHLNMYDNSFNGSIPREIYQLKNLEYLDLSDNKFNGSIIPREMFQLKHLEHLDLSGNHLTGTIPEEIGNLTKLQYLSLAGNQITGGISHGLLKLKDLKEIHLGGNLITGKIPHEIGNLVNISSFTVSNNRISGKIPNSVKRWTMLETLELHNNKLVGEIPVSLFNSSAALKVLRIEGNQLTWNNKVIIEPRCMLYALSLRSCGLAGEIPEWISRQTSLAFLDLSGNRLQGILPNSFAKINFEYLNLSQNILYGSLPPRIFQSNLLTLDLSMNNFTGTLPLNMGDDATQLIYLALNRNNFVGPIPKSISRCGDLNLLDLAENKLSGSIFLSFSNLQHVDFSSNEFTGRLPVSFSSPVLHFLLLGRNKFAGTLPSSLANLTELEYLDIHDNNLTGELPNFLFQMSALKILNLRNNSLLGSIPHNFSTQNALQVLDLSSNHLTGNIPMGIGDLNGMLTTSSITLTYALIIGMPVTNGSEFLFEAYPLLEVNWKKSAQSIKGQILDMYSLLDLSSNHLTGEIPSSLGNLKGLKLLNLSYNHLPGTIPTSFGNLENVESLDLAHNELSGSIPESLTKLQQLAVFDVSNNHLTGKIPEGGQMGTMTNPDYYANNSGFCGMQIQKPCPGQASPQQQPEEQDPSHSEEWMSFFWPAAGIGYSVGLMVSVVVIYFTSSYCSVLPRI